MYKKIIFLLILIKISKIHFNVMSPVHKEYRKSIVSGLIAVGQLTGTSTDFQFCPAC